MSKDPAVLFYTSDFMSGVVGLTMQERGQYISMLCIQHQQGHLSEKTICLLLGIVSVSEIPDVMEKFKVDESGKYYNERMELEAEKRHNFVESRKENAKLGGRPKKNESKHTNNHMKNHMDTHMGNVNEDKDDSILDSSNMELRENNEDSNVDIPILTKTEKELRDKQKKNRTKKSSNSDGRISEFITFVDSRSFSDELRESVINWLAFKKQSGHCYKEISLKTLLNQIEKKVVEVGEKAVIARIDTAIASEWIGINLDTMVQQRQTYSPKPTGEPKGGVTRITPDFFTKLAKEHKENDT